MSLSGRKRPRVFVPFGWLPLLYGARKDAADFISIKQMHTYKYYCGHGFGYCSSVAEKKIFVWNQDSFMRNNNWNEIRCSIRQHVQIIYRYLKLRLHFTYQQNALVS